VVIKNIEFNQGNYTVECYKTPKDKKPIAYLLYNEKVLSDEGLPCIQVLRIKPTRFKPLVEGKDGLLHFDLDWLDDLENYTEITGQKANNLIQAIKEEYEDQQK
jgi:hypothetical protein